MADIADLVIKIRADTAAAIDGIKNVSSSLKDIPDEKDVKVSADAKDVQTGAQQANTSLKTVDEQAKQTGSNIQAAFKGLGADLASQGKLLTMGVTAPLMAIGALAVQSAKDVGGAFKQIQIQTGATGKELESLKGSFKNVLGSVPEDAKTVVTAMDTIHQRTGLVGPALEGLTTEFMNLSRMTGESAASTSQAVTMMANRWQISSQDIGKQMDFVFAQSQRGNMSFTTLATTVTTMQPMLKQFGFGFQNSTQMLASFNAMGIKSTTVTTAFRTALNKFNKEHIDATKGFDALIQRLNKLPDGLTKTNLAMTYFGTRAGPAMLQVLKDSPDIFSGVNKDLDTFTGRINQTAKETMSFSQSMEILKNKLEVALQPLGSAILNTFQNLLPSLEPIIGVISTIVNLFAKLPQPVQEAIVLLAGAAAALGPMELVASKVMGTMSTLVPALLNAGSAAANFGSNLADSFSSLSSDAANIQQTSGALTHLSASARTTGNPLLVTKSAISEVGAASLITGSQIPNVSKGISEAEKVATTGEKQLSGFRKTMATIGDNASGISLALAAVGIAFVLAYQNIPAFKKGVDDLVAGVQKFGGYILAGDFKGAMNYLDQAFSGIGKSISQIDWKAVANVIVSGLKTALIGIINIGGDILGGIRDSIVNSHIDWKGVGSTIVSDIWEVIKAIVIPSADSDAAGQHVGDGVREGIKKSITTYFKGQFWADIWNALIVAPGQIMEGIGETVWKAIQGYLDKHPLTPKADQVQVTASATTKPATVSQTQPPSNSPAEEVSRKIQASPQWQWLEQSVGNINWANIKAAVTPHLQDIFHFSDTDPLGLKKMYQDALTAVKSIDWKKIGGDIKKSLQEGLSFDLLGWLRGGGKPTNQPSTGSSKAGSGAGGTPTAQSGWGLPSIGQIGSMLPAPPALSLPALPALPSISPGASRSITTIGKIIDPSIILSEIFSDAIADMWKSIQDYWHNIKWPDLSKLLPSSGKGVQADMGASIQTNLVDPLMKWVGNLKLPALPPLPTLPDIGKTVGDFFAPLVSWAKGLKLPALPDIGKSISDMFAGLKNINVGAGLGSLGGTISDAFTNSVVNPIKTAFAGIKLPSLGDIGGWFTQFISTPIQGFFSGIVMQGLGEVASWFVNSIWQPISGFFSGIVMKGLGEVASWFINSIWSPIAGFFAHITGIPAGLDVGGWFVSAIENPILEWMRSTENSLRSALNKIPIAGGALASLVPRTQIVGTNKPTGGGVTAGLNAYAQGGVVDSTTIGVVGEAGAEAIIPLQGGKKVRIPTRWVSPLINALIDSGYLSVQQGIRKLLPSTTGFRSFATGGIAYAPTPAIVGDAGAEAIVPFASFQTLIDLAKVIAENIVPIARSTAKVPDMSLQNQMSIAILKDLYDISHSNATAQKYGLDKLVAEMLESLKYGMSAADVLNTYLPRLNDINAASKGQIPTLTAAINAVNNLKKPITGTGSGSITPNENLANQLLTYLGELANKTGNKELTKIVTEIYSDMLNKGMGIIQALSLHLKELQDINTSTKGSLGSLDKVVAYILQLPTFGAPSGVPTPAQLTNQTDTASAIWAYLQTLKGKNIDLDKVLDSIWKDMTSGMTTSDALLAHLKELEDIKTPIGQLTTALSYIAGLPYLAPKIDQLKWILDTFNLTNEQLAELPAGFRKALADWAAEAIAKLQTGAAHQIQGVGYYAPSGQLIPNVFHPTEASIGAPPTLGTYKEPGLNYPTPPSTQQYPVGSMFYGKSPEDVQLLKNFLIGHPDYAAKAQIPGWADAMITWQRDAVDTMKKWDVPITMIEPFKDWVVTVLPSFLKDGNEDIKKMAEGLVPGFDNMAKWEQDNAIKYAQYVKEYTDKQLPASEMLSWKAFDTQNWPTEVKAMHDKQMGGVTWLGDQITSVLPKEIADPIVNALNNLPPSLGGPLSDILAVVKIGVSMLNMVGQGIGKIQSGISDVWTGIKGTLSRVQSYVSAVQAIITSAQAVQKDISSIQTLQATGPAKVDYTQFTQYQTLLDTMDKGLMSNALYLRTLATGDPKSGRESTLLQEAQGSILADMQQKLSDAAAADEATNQKAYQDSMTTLTNQLWTDVQSGFGNVGNLFMMLMDEIAGQGFLSSFTQMIGGLGSILAGITLIGAPILLIPGLLTAIFAAVSVGDLSNPISAILATLGIGGAAAAPALVPGVGAMGLSGAPLIAAMTGLPLALLTGGMVAAPAMTGLPLIAALTGVPLALLTAGLAPVALPALAPMLLAPLLGIPFAEGGVVKHPTLAVIGERGTEYVIPENKMAAFGGGDNVTINVTLENAQITQDTDYERVASEIYNKIQNAGMRTGIRL